MLGSSGQRHGAVSDSGHSIQSVCASPAQFFPCSHGAATRSASIPALPLGGSCPGQAGADLGRFLLAVPSKEAAPRCAKGNCSAHPSSSKKDVTGDALREENQRRAGLFQGVCQCIAFVLFFKSREKAEGEERHPGRYCGQGAPCSQPRGKPTTFPGTSAGSPEFLTLTLPHSSSSDVQQMNGSMKCRSVSERFSIRGGAG